MQRDEGIIGVDMYKDKLGAMRAATAVVTNLSEFWMIDDNPWCGQKS